MILIDTSIWVDHLRSRNDELADLIAQERVVHHPFVTGEVGMGSFSSPEARAIAIEFLMGLEPAEVASEPAFHEFVSAGRLYGSGAGFVDCHLLASAASSPDVRLWTRDKRLAAQAERVGVSLYR